MDPKHGFIFNAFEKLWHPKRNVRFAGSMSMLCLVFLCLIIHPKVMAQSGQDSSNAVFDSIVNNAIDSLAAKSDTNNITGKDSINNTALISDSTQSDALLNSRSQEEVNGSLKELFIANKTGALDKPWNVELIRRCGILDPKVPIWSSDCTLVNWDSLSAEKFMYDRRTGDLRGKTLTADEQRKLTFNEFLYGLKNELGYGFGLLYYQKPNGEKLPMYLRFYFPTGKNFYMNFADVKDRIAPLDLEIRQEFYNNYPEQSKSAIQNYAKYDRKLLQNDVVVQSGRCCYATLAKGRKWVKIVKQDTSGLIPLKKYKWKKYSKMLDVFNIDPETRRYRPSTLVWEFGEMLRQASDSLPSVNIDSNRAIQFKHEQGLKVNNEAGWDDIFDTPTEVEISAIYVEQNAFLFHADPSGFNFNKVKRRLEKIKVGDYYIVTDHYLNMDHALKTNFRFLIDELNNEKYKKQGDVITYKTGEILEEKDVFVHLVYNHHFTNGTFDHKELVKVELVQNPNSAYIKKAAGNVMIGSFTPQQFYAACSKHKLKKEAKIVRKGKKPMVSYFTKELRDDY